MKTQSYKRLMQYCDFISVLSLFASIAYGFSQIVPLCYEMGKTTAILLYGKRWYKPLSVTPFSLSACCPISWHAT